ncbi:hypothetical protein [Planomonospora venezuelensis]|uniref:Uncharacterized protein n=1 Tax=Planomonospora venezuelensis TaxID=1999 RepID=A0A841CYD8_PLAVE|nr:hypothetical protein [Planomonospora venezuelensis]MBB5961324.1 hypothetical protein [Planomonospora venezuelensis]GIN01934.1 hypothetical protein Pve01_35920 [Planomonospora venezuelensis]
MSETPRHVRERAEERTGEGASERAGEEASKAARTGGSARQMEQPDAKRVADAEAAPEQEPKGSELVGREDDNELEGDPERMVASQRLWDGSLATSRLDEAMPRGQDEDPAGAPDPGGRGGGTA